MCPGKCIASLSNLPNPLCCLSRPLNVGAQLRSDPQHNGACLSRVLLGGALSSHFHRRAVKVDLLLLLWRSRVEWDVGNFAGRRLRREVAEATARHYNGKMEAAVDDDDVEAEETDGWTDRQTLKETELHISLHGTGSLNSLRVGQELTQTILVQSITLKGFAISRMYLID